MSDYDIGPTLHHIAPTLAQRQSDVSSPPGSPSI